MRIYKQAGFSWIVVILAILLVLVGGLIFYNNSKTEPVVEVIPTPTKPWSTKSVVGQSVQGKDIEAYSYGNGTKHLLIVGGIHGKYEENSTRLAEEIQTYLSKEESIPENVIVSVIPNLNPDAVKTATSSGRFNANNVDLNRNFDCKWQATSTWRSMPVSAGTSAFSEPESKALRDFVIKQKPKAVVFLHSQANAVYASECENGILPETRTIMNLYSQASGYKAVDTFDAYPVTGDAEGWLASIGIPAITVELSTHETTEYDKNLAGVKALFEYYVGK